MTVTELIEVLKTFPPNQHVMIHGYEGGILDVKNIHNIRAVIDYYKGSGYYGPHKEIDDFFDEEATYTDLDHEDNNGRTYEVIDALLISRYGS